MEFNLGQSLVVGQVSRVTMVIKANGAILQLRKEKMVPTHGLYSTIRVGAEDHSDHTLHFASALCTGTTGLGCLNFAEIRLLSDLGSTCSSDLLNIDH